MKIEYESSPSIADTEFLTQKINEETLEFGSAYPFAFFIRENGKIIAGANGSVVFGAIYTDQLWVHPDYRKKGFGEALMEHIETWGLENGCTLSTVSTMSFQGAKEFYEKLGFAVDFARAGYAHTSKIYYMSKNIS